jgi:hypothetical protein
MISSADIGRWIETVVPRSTPSLSTSTLPPLALMKALVIQSPSPEPEVVDGVARPAEKAAADLAPFFLRQPGTIIVNRQHDRAAMGVSMGVRGNADRRTDRRILRGVVDDLNKRLLDLRRIDMDDRQVGIEIELSPDSR